MVEVTLQLPEDIARQVAAVPGEIPRRILETIAADLYRAGKLSHDQVEQLLRLDSGQTDAFLEERRARMPSEPENRITPTDPDLEAFRRALPDLLITNHGHFAAISNGCIVELDPDEYALAQRVSGRSGRVLIQKITDAGGDEIHMDTPEFECSKMKGV